MSRSTGQNSELLDWVLELVSYKVYNSERGLICNELIRRQLKDSKKKVDIESSVKNLNENNASRTCLTGFQSYDSVLTSELDPLTIEVYCDLRYKKYATIFREETEVELGDFIQVVVHLFRRQKPAKAYQFTNKEDYFNPNFLAEPTKSVIKQVRKEMCFTAEDISNETTLTSAVVRHCLRIFSISHNEELVRICTTPILHFDDRYVLIDRQSFLSHLPQGIDLILRSRPSYLKNRGKDFEKICRSVFSAFPGASIEGTNEVYADGEVDLIVSFQRSRWFVDCKTRPIRELSYVGDTKAAKKDYERGVVKGLKQTERAIKNFDTSNMPTKYVTGSLVITEAVYPNKNIMEITEVLNTDIRYITMNIFELLKIREQPENRLFDSFLIWRTSSDMPIICFDELDY